MDYRLFSRRSTRGRSIFGQDAEAPFTSSGRPAHHRIATVLAVGIGLSAIVLGLYPSHEAGANRETPNVTAPDSRQVTLALPVPGSTAATAAPGEMPRALAEPVAAPAREDAPAPPAAVAEPPAESPAPVPEEAVAEAAAPAASDLPWTEVTVKSGDTLAAIFSRQGLSATTLHRILSLGDATRSLTRIYPGQALRFRIDPEQGLRELVYQEDITRSLRIWPEDGGFRAATEERALETRVGHSAGDISDSLYQSAQRAGLSDALIMELAGIFGWDVDFALDIREGDSFAVSFEQRFLDGEWVRDGDILAAEFVNQGRVYQAVRYTDASGHTDYYTPEGLSMRKAFLRAPVDFRRISSRFTRERFHPVLGKKRPHQGVDYAAATGTPIWAAGDGKVVFAGRKGGYGNAVILQHGEKYSTLYGHMSRFGKGIRSGTRVRQGQVIGYVGATGLATGPHLHYEFRVDGVHRNPLTVKLPEAEPIKAAYRADFLGHAKRTIAQLDTYKSSTLALQDR
ncbi:MAG: peptidoglycan DD-metalloendopeptidase family protein [Gammaproteobacteria bacterium]|nr:peptidoglycan DD-metalloendopeptidase family protein [Gammaproteobacteria bacterium]